MKKDYIFLPIAIVLYVVFALLYTVCASIYWIWTRKVLQVF